MDNEQIIRAWKDEEYRSALGETESALLPENPAGIVDISDESLGKVGGYTVTIQCTGNTWGEICTEFYASLALGGTCRNLTTGCCKALMDIY
jgi:mersacidin/lichenicidin family type 2 lantibiotic